MGDPPPAPGIGDPPPGPPGYPAPGIGDPPPAPGIGDPPPAPGMGEPLEGGGLIGPPPIGEPALGAWDSVGAGAPPLAPPADPTWGRAAPSVGASATATAESSFLEQPVRTAGSTIMAARGPCRKKARQSHQRMSFTFRQLHRDHQGVRQVAERREKGAVDRCLLFAIRASFQVFFKIDVA
jgi:hypothetical protein